MIRIDIQKELLGDAGKIEFRTELEVASGSFVAIAGESGSGKSTLLRILAGLEEAKGVIEVNGRRWLDGKSLLPPQKREIGFVFQDYALFENMSVLENLLFVQKDQKLAMHLLSLTSLLELADRMPPTLSGGQKQRVALCRALMRRPKILLMDEPLSALDPQMRRHLQEEIWQLHREFGTTTLMVSHDPSEIYRLANRVILIHQGRIVDDGSPTKVLLKTEGSQKFSFRGEVLDLLERDVIHVAIVAIGQQLVEVVIDRQEAKSLKVGDRVSVSTKAFAPALEILTPRA